MESVKILLKVEDEENILENCNDEIESYKLFIDTIANILDIYIVNNEKNSIG